MVDVLRAAAQVAADQIRLSQAGERMRNTSVQLALLLKLEIGAACYATLALLIATRGLRQRSWKTTIRDLAVCLPGVAACAMVLMWMVSLRGAEFLTQENIMSWPNSFFMRTYGNFGSRPRVWT